MIIHLEAFINGAWHLIGQVEIPTSKISQGFRAPGDFNYDLEYLDLFGEHLQTNGYFAASLRYPLNYGSYPEKHWPAFLLDLMPTGAARENWLKRLNIKDGPAADFELLSQGAINPPGHIRVKNSMNLFNSTTSHAGFDYQDVISRGVDFIDYAERMGAIVSGTSGAQGVAPKFLLTEDNNGKWHGDGALADDLIKKSWLVKFPRGKKVRDYQILQAESQYYEIARDLGVRTLGPLTWSEDTLFVPRFDRVKDAQGKLVRFGLESIVSSAGVSEFGATLSNEEYVALVGKYCTEPKKEILEYIFRDFMYVVCGNTDNHGRNTAFLKKPDGRIEIAPLFDFAPMVLDDAGIPRVSKWENESFQIPDFKVIYNVLLKHKFEPEEASIFMKDSLTKIENLHALFRRHSVETQIVSIVTSKYDEFTKTLSRFVGSL